MKSMIVNCLYKHYLTKGIMKGEEEIVVVTKSLHDKEGDLDYIVRVLDGRYKLSTYRVYPENRRDYIYLGTIEEYPEYFL